MSAIHEAVEALLNDGQDVIRIWPYQDAPVLLSGLATMTEDVMCVVAIPTHMIELVADWLGDILYNGYIAPEKHVFGEYTVFIVYN